MFRSNFKSSRNDKNRTQFISSNNPLGKSVEGFVAFFILVSNILFLLKNSILLSKLDIVTKANNIYYRGFLNYCNMYGSS